MEDQRRIIKYTDESKRSQERRKRQNREVGQIESKNMTAITYICICVGDIYIYNYIKCNWTK